MKLMSLVAVLAASSVVVAQTNQSEKIEGLAQTTTTAQSKVTGSASGLPAAATSQTIANPDQNILTRFSGSFVDQMETTHDDFVTGNASDSTVTHAMGAALNYKFNDRFSVGVGQDAETKTQSGADNNFFLTHTSLRLGTQTEGIFGSEKIKPLFRYYLPTTAAKDAFKRGYGTEDDITGYNGLLRLDVQLVWTLNSLMNVSYYMNPRQTLADKQTLTVIRADGQASDVTFESISRYYQVLALNFTPNDILGPYVYLAQDYRFVTETFTESKAESLLGIGTSISLGKFTINPEVYSSNVTKAGFKTKSPRYLSHETLNYYLAASVAF